MTESTSNAQQAAAQGVGTGPNYPANSFAAAAAASSTPMPSTSVADADQAPPYEVLRRRLLTYEIGQFRGPLGRDVSTLPSKQMSIGVFGYAGSGKSCLINTMCRALSDLDELHFFADPRDPGLLHGTRNYRRYALKPTPNGIDVYDSRGLNFVDLKKDGEAEEVLKFITGQGTQGYVSRQEDFTVDQRRLLDRYKFQFEHDSTANPLDCVIVAIPYVEPIEVQCRNIAELLQLLRIVDYKPVIIVITRLDEAERNGLSADAVRDIFSLRLNVAKHKIFAIENYYEARQRRQRERTDRTALYIMQECLRSAEINCDFKFNRNRVQLHECQDYIKQNWQSWLIVVLVLALAIVVYGWSQDHAGLNKFEAKNYKV